MSSKDFDKLMEMIEKRKDEIRAEALKDFNTLPAEEQQEALKEFAELYPQSFERLFGKDKN